jgi:hypothetical protein
MTVPVVVRAVAGPGRTVYAYFSDGKISQYDMTGEIERGGVFAQLADDAFFSERLTVMNGTIAWGDDPRSCIDVDPLTVYAAPAPNDAAISADDFQKWDPDFVKVTPEEAASMAQALDEFAAGETVPHEAIDWD